MDLRNTARRTRVFCATYVVLVGPADGHCSSIPTGQSSHQSGARPSPSLKYTSKTSAWFCRSYHYQRSKRDDCAENGVASGNLRHIGGIRDHIIRGRRRWRMRRYPRLNILHSDRWRPAEAGARGRRGRHGGIGGDRCVDAQDIPWQSIVPEQALVVRSV